MLHLREIPRLTTERLELKALTSEHSAGMYALWSAPQVCEYSGSAVDFTGNPIELPAISAADSDRIIDFFAQHQRQGSAFRWAMMLRESQEFAGAIGFNSIAECSEIAYHLVPGYWGKGLMSEACRSAIGWVTATIGVTAIEAFIEPANVASIGLIDRLGFTATGESKDGADRYLLTIDVSGYAGARRCGRSTCESERSR